MRRVLILSLVTAVLFLHCSEKAAFEPCGSESGYLCGEVYPPTGFNLSPDDLSIGIITDLGRLSRDWSFSIPSSRIGDARIVVLAAEDTIPVMLGYSLPMLQRQNQNEANLSASDQDLLDIVGTPESGVRISSASTALTLTMVSPLFGDATEEERAWFASQVVADEGYQGLVQEITEAQRTNPKSYLDGETCGGIYPRVSEIISRVVAEIDRGDDGGSPGEGPQVTDASGDAIGLSNPRFIHYGVRISDAVADTSEAVFLLWEREVSSLIIPQPPFRKTYSLGDGYFDVEFFKGVTGIDSGCLLDPEHPGGLATIANVAQARWNVVTIFATLPHSTDPGLAPLPSVECAASIMEAVGTQNAIRTIEEVAGCCCRDADQMVAWLFGEEVNPADFARFVSSVRRVLSNNLISQEETGLDMEGLFFADLVTSPDYQSVCVCQRDGVMSTCPDRPTLSEGTVFPTSGGIDTEFTFWVHYYDELQDPPSRLQVILDQEPHDMSLVSGERHDGTYHYVTLLGPGKHTYFFSCSDTTGATTRFPSEGPVDGPFVYTPPVLTGGRVSPSTGTDMTTFAYAVKCTDADGEDHSWVRVFIDDEPHTMRVSSGRNYIYTTNLAPGTHTYYFVAVDPSGHDARLPDTGVREAPFVSHAPDLSRPRVRPPSGPRGMTFKFEVDYVDLDGDPPSYVRAYIDDVRRDMILKNETASDGVYCCDKLLRTLGYHEYYFTCMDSTGAVVRLPESGAYRGPYVDTGGDRNPFAKVAVHVQAHNPNLGCTRDFPPMRSCADIVATYPDAGFDCFPVFFDVSEYQGLEFSLSWPEWTYSASWHSCADISIGDISRPGDGVAVGWNECRPGPTVIPGWAWMYADGPGLVCVSAHPVSGIAILDCYGGTSQPIYNFCAGVCGAEGHDP